MCSTAEPQDKTDLQGHGSPPWVVAPTLRAEPVLTEAEKCLLPVGCLLPNGTKKALSQPKSAMRGIPPNHLEERKGRETQVLQYARAPSYQGKHWEWGRSTHLSRLQADEPLSVLHSG